MYKHILIATDLGKDSEQICAKAQQLAKLTNAKLSLVHVLETNFSYAFTYSWPEDLIEQLTKEVTEQFANLGQRYGIASKEQYILEGIPKLKVLEVAKNIEADCIVVGKHARHGLQGMLGSTASAILRHTETDVWAVLIK